MPLPPFSTLLDSMCFEYMQSLRGLKNVLRGEGSSHRRSRAVELPKKKFVPPKLPRNAISAAPPHNPCMLHAAIATLLTDLRHFRLFLSSRLLLICHPSSY